MEGDTTIRIKEEVYMLLIFEYCGSFHKIGK
jgi:hypothetical protein